MKGQELRTYTVLVLEMVGVSIDNAYSNNLDFIPGRLWQHADRIRCGVTMDQGIREPFQVMVIKKGQIAKCSRCRFYHFTDYRGECGSEDDSFARISTDWREGEWGKIPSRRDYEG